MSRLIAFALALSVAGPLRGQDNPVLSESVKALYQNQFARSEALAARFLKAHPGHVRGLVLLARAEMAQGKVEPAYRTLTKALRADPKNADALYYLGRLCLALSEGQYEGLYAMAPDSARVHQLLAESARSRHDLRKAEEEYQAALRANPASVEVLNSLGDMKRHQFKFEEAVSYYSKAAAIQPRDYDSAYGLGAAYLYLQNPGRAVEYLRRAVQIDPASAPAYLALGDAYLRAGRAEEAVTELRTAVRLQPDMRQAYVLLGRAYSRLGKKEEANKALALAQELQQKEKAKLVETLASDDLVTPPPTPAQRPEEGEPIHP